MTMSTTAKYTTAVALQVGVTEIAVRAKSPALMAATTIAHAGALVWTYTRVGLGGTLLVLLLTVPYKLVRSGALERWQTGRAAGSAPAPTAVQS